jgi:hypothetical protein
MSVRAFTEYADALLTKIKRLIDQGHITTWSYDEEGDFTHTATQWKNRAWLRPQVQPDRLRLVIRKSKTVPLTREVFAIYHGRFIEMLIEHVPKDFVRASATPNPVKGDAAIQG